MLTTSLLQFLCAASVTSGSGLYGPSSSVIDLTSTNFEEVVLSTNHSSLVEFYAPWCGHCQRLTPHFERTASHLKDLAIVGAVNCDLSKNKPLCAKYRVEGYPTLLAFRAPKVNVDHATNKDRVKYAHATEIYHGSRKTKPMVDFMTSRIKNYVKRLITDSKLSNWLESGERPKIVVFTKKDKLSPLLKAIAVDLLGLVDVAYVPLTKGGFEDWETEDDSSVVYFVNSSGKVKYNGELTKDGIVKFVGEFGVNVTDVLERIQFLEDVRSGKVKKIKKKNNNNKNVRDEL